MSYHLFLVGEIPQLRVMNHTAWDLAKDGGPRVSYEVKVGRQALLRAIELKILAPPKDKNDIEKWKSLKEFKSLEEKQPVGRPRKDKEAIHFFGYEQRLSKVERDILDSSPEAKSFTEEQEEVIEQEDLSGLVNIVKNPPRFKNEDNPLYGKKIITKPTTIDTRIKSKKRNS